jgi:prepilin-type N-terminal cleavage/methylation domain-containing protein
MSSRRGFTLIELLIVVVIIGILAAIAVPKFNSTKGKAHAAALKGDLHNLSTAQESYFYTWQTYTADTSALNWKGSTGSSLTIVNATRGGWSATATHPLSYPLTCAMFQGSVAPVAPATVEGVITCR